MVRPEIENTIVNQPNVAVVTRYDFYSRDAIMDAIQIDLTTTGFFGVTSGVGVGLDFALGGDFFSSAFFFFAFFFLLLGAFLFRPCQLRHSADQVVAPYLWPE